MRVLMGFSDKEVIEQVKIFLVKLWERRHLLGI